MRRPIPRRQTPRRPIPRRPIQDLIGDRDALLAAIRSSTAHEYDFVALNEALRADPELAAAVRADQEPWSLRLFDRWLRREVLPLDQRDLGRFCALATDVARQADPQFPALDPAGLVQVRTEYYRWFHHMDARVDGIGWVLDQEIADEGPAEAVHVEHWRAEAHGKDFRYDFGFEYEYYFSYMWVERIAS